MEIETLREATESKLLARWNILLEIGDDVISFIEREGTQSHYKFAWDSLCRRVANEEDVDFERYIEYWERVFKNIISDGIKYKIQTVEDYVETILTEKKSK